MAAATQYADRKNFAKADETRTFPKGRLDVVTVGGHSMGAPYSSRVGNGRSA